MAFQIVNRRLILLAAALQFGGAQAAALKGPFTGAFWGSYEGCWGGLFIRDRTIQWKPGDASCERTGYTVIDEDMHTPFQDYDHIVYRLHHLSKGCPIPYVGLYYYLPKQEAMENKRMPTEEGRRYNDWTGVAFENYSQYAFFHYKKFLNGTFDVDPMKLAYWAFLFGTGLFPTAYLFVECSSDEQPHVASIITLLYLTICSGRN